MAGLSTAYHLARRGARTLVLQAGELGGGTSAACSGRAQVNEGHLDPLNLRLVRDGLARLDTLEEELDFPFEWRRTGYLCLINSQELWAEWEERAGILTKAGIPTEMLDRDAVRAAEPYLDASGFLGAAYSVEGQLNPFLFCWAYAVAARRCGAELRPHMPVTEMEVDGGRVVGVEALGERYRADRVAVMCGAWTPQLLSLIAASLPIHHTHAEAFVTEPTSLPLHNTIGLADFYETIHGAVQAVSVGFSRESNGSLVVTESVAQTDELHRRSSAWGLTGMATDLIQLYPALGRTRVVRAWGIPTPFTPDDEPVVGWLPGWDNVFVAASFLVTITTLPLLSEWMADMIVEQEIDADLSPYAPNRFSSDEGGGDRE
jgi:sarcosine oxidase subunit beta